MSKKSEVFQTPRSLWSKELRELANNYRRNWIEKDSSFCGGHEDRYPLTEKNGREIKKESDRRVWEKYNEKFS